MASRFKVDYFDSCAAGDKISTDIACCVVPLQ